VTDDELDPDVAWCLEAMAAQIPETGLIPFSQARPVLPEVRGVCLSCGDPLPEGAPTRCRPCAAAAESAVRRVEERRKPPAEGAAS